MRKFSSQCFGISVPLLPLAFYLGDRILCLFNASTRIYTWKSVRSLRILRGQNGEQARPKTKQEGKKSSDPIIEAVFIWTVSGNDLHYITQCACRIKLRCLFLAPFITAR